MDELDRGAIDGRAVADRRERTWGVIALMLGLCAVTAMVSLALVVYVR